MDDPQKHINKFDRILKENIEPTFGPIASELLGIEIEHMEDLKMELHVTTERSVDFLKKIVTKGGEKFILHLEFQTKDAEDMVFRVSEYHAIILKREKLPIRHHVIYIGEDVWTAPTELKESMVFTGFHLFSVRDTPFFHFINSTVAETVILGILSKYPKEEDEIVVSSIISRLRALCKHPNHLRKYLKQLTVFARLRNLEELVKKKSIEMPITFGNRDHTKDYWYIEGQKDTRAEAEAQIEAKIMEVKIEAEAKIVEAKVEAETKAVNNMLGMGLSPEMISEALEIAVEKILAIQKKKG